MEPKVSEVMQFLSTLAMGAGRKELLVVAKLKRSALPWLEAELESAGAIQVGRGPGIKWVHPDQSKNVPLAQREQQDSSRKSQIEGFRHRVRHQLQQHGERSCEQVRDAIHGLDANCTRWLIGQFVEAGFVEKTGKKRNMRYRWIGSK